MKNNIPENVVKHSYTLDVTASDLDELNHVNNIIYLKWVQEASRIHWNILASDKVKNEVLWIVLRHEIDYKNQAFLADKITVVTWIGESKGVRSVRHVNFYKDDKLLVSCKTTWCLLNSKTMKPKLIEGDVFDLLTR